ncbi:MAG: YfiH family protein [Glaciecola sp.]|uniref:peptidoglycan editing factor PgeF n=1 Tax=Congregibacter sp. TaxID=2744308 RepID=UPI0039E43253
MSVHEVRLADWPGNVRIFYTTREGGCSDGPYHGFNLGLHVGDFEQSVRRNRAELLEHLPPGARIAWLDQVHGTDVVKACDSIQAPLSADGCWTTDSGIACAVMVADCLPVLLTDHSGSVVAAVHAGWQGLVAGVLDAAVSKLNVAPQELCAWLGPAIGSDEFEVGPEVRAAFMRQNEAPGTDSCFKPSMRRSGHYLADLPSLAEQRLTRLGLLHIQRAEDCTVSDPRRFFSYRRDGVTGRMSCLILRNP